EERLALDARWMFNGIGEVGAVGVKGCERGGRGRVLGEAIVVVERAAEGRRIHRGGLVVKNRAAAVNMRGVINNGRGERGDEEQPESFAQQVTKPRPAMPGCVNGVVELSGHAVLAWLNSRRDFRQHKTASMFV